MEDLLFCLPFLIVNRQVFSDMGVNEDVVLQKMKLLKPLTILLCLVSMSCSLELGFYPLMKVDGKQDVGKLFELEKSADRTMNCDIDGYFDIYIGRVDKNVRYPKRFTFEEIEFFLKNEKHKNLVVVWFDKSIMWNEDEIISQRSKAVVKSMRDLGYKRVVILGAHSMGVHYVADTNLKIK